MSDFQVGPETFVTARVVVFDAEEEEACAPEVTGFVFGMGQLLGPVEQALEGRRAGEVVEVRLGEKDGFGARDPRRILEVDRAEFPPEVSPGDRFEVENLEGGVLVLQVLDVGSDLVVVDTNHPLSGQEVKFLVEIQEVRPASSEELEAAEALLQEDQEYLSSQSGNGSVPDVSAAALIRRPQPS